MGCGAGWRSRSRTRPSIPQLKAALARRRRRCDDPGPVRQRGLVGAVPGARRRAGHGGTHAGGADGQGRSADAAPRRRDAGTRADGGCRIRGAGRRPGDRRRGGSGRRRAPRRFDVPDAGDVARGAGPAKGDRRPGPALRRAARRFGRGHRPPADGSVGAGRQGGGRARAGSGGGVARARRAGGAEAVALGAACIHGGAGLGRDPGAARRRCRSPGRGGVPPPARPRGAAAANGTAGDGRVGRQGLRLAADDQRAGRAQAARDAAVRAGRGDRPPAHRDVQRWHAARFQHDAGLERRHRRPRRGAGRVLSRARPRRYRVEYVRALSAAGAAGRGRDGRALHGGPARRGGLPARVTSSSGCGPQVARNRAAVEQFIDEAKLGSTLVHSNIVPGVRLRQGRRRVLPRAGVHHRARRRTGC